MKIIFPIDVYQKLRAYVESVKVEISGLGRVSIHGDSIVIEEIKIFKQVCSAGGTVLDKRAISDFWDTLEDPSGWKLWWHSHGQLQAYFSSTDESTIADFDNQTKEDNWQLSIVTNRKGEVKARVDFFSPFAYTIEDIDWEIDFVPRKLEDEVFTEVSQKVQIYHEKTTDTPKRKKSTAWDDQVPLDPLLLESAKHVILDRQGRRVAVHDLDPADLAKHPELFGGIIGNGKKK